MADFIHATGIRRQSVPVIRPSDAIRREDNRVICFHVKEKGGKARNCCVLKEKQEEITRLVDAGQKEHGNSPLFDTPDKNLNTHWYRAQYARDLYERFSQVEQEETDYFDGYDHVFLDYGKLEQAVRGHAEQTKDFES